MYKDWGAPNTDTLQDLGEYLVAPLLAKAFLKLYEVAENTSNPLILFPSREGWFFRKAWLFCVSEGHFSEKIPTKYFYANRRAVNRSHRILSDEFLPSIAKSDFNGFFEDFFESRLGLSGNPIRVFLASRGIKAEDWLSLPSDQKLLVEILRGVKAKSDYFGLERDSLEYKAYLRELVGENTPIYFDLGYSGSVVESLQYLLEAKFPSVFFQVHLSREGSNDFRLQNCLSALTEPCYADSPDALGELSIILESIFRAPERGFITVDSQHRPVFDNVEEISEDIFVNLGQIVNGAERGLSKMLTKALAGESHIEKLCNLVLLAASTGGFAADSSTLRMLKLEDSYSGRRNLINTNL